MASILDLLRHSFRAPSPHVLRQDVPVGDFTSDTAYANIHTIYEEAAHCSRAYKLALLGLTVVEIAEQSGIWFETLHEWQEAYREFLRPSMTEMTSQTPKSLPRCLQTPKSPPRCLSAPSVTHRLP
jgi:hypothetical protein